MDFDPLQLISPLASIVSGGLAGGVVSLIYNRRFYLRKLRTDLYPHVEAILHGYQIELVLPDGKGWIGEGKTFRPAPSGDEFRAKRREFIARLVGFNELEEARDLRKKMLASEIGTSSSFPREVLEAELTALNKCDATLREKLELH